jgi:hypothetical protein
MAVARQSKPRPRPNNAQPAEALIRKPSTSTCATLNGNVPILGTLPLQLRKEANEQDSQGYIHHMPLAALPLRTRAMLTAGLGPTDTNVRAESLKIKGWGGRSVADSEVQGGEIIMEEKFTKEEIGKGLDRAQDIYEGWKLDELDIDQLYEAIVQANQRRNES